MSNNIVLVCNKEMFDRAGVAYPDGNWIWDDLMDASWKIYDATGKYALEGLPAFYGREEEWGTLSVTLTDAAAQADVELFYGVFVILCDQNTDEDHGLCSGRTGPPAPGPSSGASTYFSLETRKPREA